jgi:hypothetical protein
VQSRIRANRGLKGLTRSRKCSSAGIGQRSRTLISCGLLAIFASSCSLFTNKKSNLDTQEALNKLCLSAEGRGRLEYPGGRHVVGFESLLDDEKKTWKIAFSIPTRGDEVVSFDWKKGQVSGAFVKAARAQVPPAERQRFERFFRGILSFLEDRSYPERWELSKKGLKYLWPAGGEAELEIEAFDLAPWGFARLSARGLPKENAPSLELFISQCTIE